MSTILYGIPNCNTVKKAQDWLKEKGVDYQFHNFKKDGLSAEKVEQWLEQVPQEKLINKAGMTFRKLSDDEKQEANSAAGAKALMLEKTSVIKRPIVEIDGEVKTLGFKEEDYTAIFD